jgi:hypothetical protein
MYVSVTHHNLFCGSQSTEEAKILPPDIHSARRLLSSNVTKGRNNKMHRQTSVEDIPYFVKIPTNTGLKSEDLLAQSENGQFGGSTDYYCEVTSIWIKNCRKIIIKK